MRKLNGILAALTILFLVVHGLLACLCMMGILPYHFFYIMAGRRLTIIAGCHILISIILMIQEQHVRKKIKVYYKENKDTMQQMLTGIGIIVFGVLHICLYSFSKIDAHPESMELVAKHFIVDTLLFTSLCMHLSISIPRICISWGLFTKEDTLKKVCKVSQWIMAFVLVFLMAGEIIFYIL